MIAITDKINEYRNTPFRSQSHSILQKKEPVTNQKKIIEKLNSTNRSVGSAGEELLQVKQPMIEKFQKAAS